MAYQPQLPPLSAQEPKNFPSRASLPPKSGNSGNKNGPETLTSVFSTSYQRGEALPLSPLLPLLPVTGESPREDFFSSPPKGRQPYQTDPYAWWISNALRELTRADPPAGMIPWLEQAYPWLYAEVTSRLPEDIHRLAKALAPFDEFERVLNRWLDAHREADALYRAHLLACQKPASERSMEARENGQR